MLEIQSTADLGQLDGVERTGEQGQTDDTERRHQIRHFVKPGNGRCSEEQTGINGNDDAHGDPENGGVVVIGDIFILDEGGIEAPLNEHIGQGDENGHQAELAVVLRVKDPGQHQLQQELGQLEAETFAKFPDQCGKDGFFVVISRHIWI